LRDAPADAWWKSQPPEKALVFTIDVESAAFMTWDWGTSVMNNITWSVSGGLKERSRGYP
jgi:hypothetical protein